MHATARLDIDIVTSVINGIGMEWRQSGCALVGSKTAGMPGMYHNEDCDIVSFCIGVVEKSDIMDGSKVQIGDALIVLGSSGLHANGYTVRRKILS